MVKLIAIYSLAVLALMYLTFVFLCAILKLRDARDMGALDDAPLIVKLYAYSTLFIGLLLDVTLNVLLSVVFLELPQEWLTTDRVKRLKDSGNDWQTACARWLCKQLSRIDLKHCGD